MLPGLCFFVGLAAFFFFITQAQGRGKLNVAASVV